jgi:hypothetical protein
LTVTEKKFAPSPFSIIFRRMNTSLKGKVALVTGQNSRVNGGVA